MHFRKITAAVTGSMDRVEAKPETGETVVEALTPVLEEVMVS